MHSATPSSNQPLGGVSGDWRHRFLHFHLPLAFASALVIFMWMSLPLFQAADHQGPPPAASQTSSHLGPLSAGDQTTDHQPPQADGQTASHRGPMQADATTTPIDHSGNQSPALHERQNRLLIGRFTTATGYVALGLLALTLLIGPTNLLLRKRNPISSSLRRDVGTWTAIVSAIHVVAGFFVHGPVATLGERIFYYFFAPDGSVLLNNFGLGNWTGLAATVIVVGLFAISSNVALRKLKAGPWKWLQRLNYVLFALVILHALYYGALLRVTSISTILLGLTMIVVFAGQVVGIWLWRRKSLAQPSG